MSIVRKNGNTKDTIQKQTILRQNREIEQLKVEIVKLEIEANKRDELTKTLDKIADEWIELINELEEKRKEYDSLISDMRMIKNVMNDISTKISWYKKFKK